MDTIFSESWACLSIKCWNELFFVYKSVWGFDKKTFWQGMKIKNFYDMSVLLRSFHLLLLMPIAVYQTKECVCDLCYCFSKHFKSDWVDPKVDVNNSLKIQKKRKTEIFDQKHAWRKSQENCVVKGSEIAINHDSWGERVSMWTLWSILKLNPCALSLCRNERKLFLGMVILNFYEIAFQSVVKHKKWNLGFSF